MNMLIKFAEVVNKLKNTNSSTEKVEILNKYETEPQKQIK